MGYKLMKRVYIKIITVLMLVAILVILYFKSSFIVIFWRVATSGSMQETMDYIASFWYMGDGI